MYLDEYVVLPQLEFQFNIRDITSKDTKKNSYYEIKIIDDGEILEEKINGYISSKDRQ